MKIFPESSFFKERRAPALPTPAEVRAVNEAMGENPRRHRLYASPVRMPSLGLYIKYGTTVSVLEAQNQIMLREKLHGQVPVPEVFGWTVDDKQTFIYMSLMDGEPLARRWPDMNGDERRSICKELKHMVNSWRSLKQDGDDRYIGSLGKQPLRDYHIVGYGFTGEPPAPASGPYEGANAVQQLQDACRIDIHGETPIIFTHTEFSLRWILVSAGPNPKVTAIVNWSGAGWYPEYWEYCKARYGRLWKKHFPGMTDDAQEEWRRKYLPTILDPVDTKACYDPWADFASSNF
ncbi:phosphotransferase enzyme family protein [Xylariaceae sp. FL0662B]|nr:phosphotransferase enzyme family protein [Xylariaceae sp. FL0662B]